MNLILNALAIAANLIILVLAVPVGVAWCVLDAGVEFGKLLKNAIFDGVGL